MKAKMIITILLVFLGYSIIAQNDTLRKKNIVFSGNAGWILALDENKNFLFGGGVGINFGYNNHYLVLKNNYLGSLKTREFSIYKTKSFFLMYGYGINFSNEITTIYSMGLSHNKSIWIGEQTGMYHYYLGDFPEYEKFNINSFGIPLSVSILWKTVYYAFSIDFYANINKHVDVGIVLNNHFGKIGSKKEK